jgi:hypothetical protein
MSKILELSYKKLPPGTTLDEVYQNAYMLAKNKAENNAIRLSDFSEKLKINGIIYQSKIHRLKIIQKNKILIL